MKIPENGAARNKEASCNCLPPDGGTRRLLAPHCVACSLLAGSSFRRI